MNVGKAICVFILGAAFLFAAASANGKAFYVAGDSNRTVGGASCGDALSVACFNNPAIDRAHDAAEARDSRVVAFGEMGVDLVEQSITEVRTMSYLSYPSMLEEARLETAIPWYLDGFTRRSGIQTTGKGTTLVLRISAHAATTSHDPA
jgi:hypothetical protein